MEPRSREKNGRTLPWAARKWLRYEDKLGDRMIKQLLNSIIVKYRDLSEASRSIICLSLRLRQIIDLLASDKSRYFPQPRPIIVNYLYSRFNVICSWKSLPISLSCKLLPVQWREYQLADKISQWTPKCLEQQHSTTTRSSGQIFKSNATSLCSNKKRPEKRANIP